MPRFVVLQHEPGQRSDKPLHWDLMLEWGAALRTWSLANEPQPNVQIAAQQLADHRPAYLEYEGEVSGGRGQVQQWDFGSYDLMCDDESIVTVLLRGRRLTGEATLRRTENHQRWMFALVLSNTDR